MYPEMRALDVESGVAGGATKNSSCSELEDLVEGGIVLCYVCWESSDPHSLNYDPKPSKPHSIPFPRGHRDAALAFG